MRYAGAGTQRAEREVAAAFPGARLARLDLDVAREQGRAATVLQAFARGEADILIGTQMIAKGLDFPRVTLVGVLDADVALHLPDFRAAERTYQLIVQVAGRAGRGPRPGEVFVQTCSPDHPAIMAAILGDERQFLDRELEQRREAGYPPYVRLVSLLFSGRDEAAVERAAGEVAQVLRGVDAIPGVEVLGPAPQALARLRNQFRWHVLLKGTHATALHEVARRGLAAAEGSQRARGVKVIADVDPVEVL